MNNIKLLLKNNYFCYTVSYNLNDFYEMFEYIMKNKYELNDCGYVLKRVFLYYCEYNKNYGIKHGVFVNDLYRNFQINFSELVFKYNFYDLFVCYMGSHEINEMLNYNFICVYGNYDVLINLTLKNIKLTKKNMENIFKNNYVDILKWFYDKKNNKKKINYNKNCMHEVFKNGSLDILIFLHHNKLKIKYNYKSINYAINNNHHKIINWMTQHGYEIKQKN
jgi:hypothetical protein